MEFGHRSHYDSIEIIIYFIGAVIVPTVYVGVLSETFYDAFVFLFGFLQCLLIVTLPANMMVAIALIEVSICIIFIKGKHKEASINT